MKKLQKSILIDFRFISIKNQISKITQGTQNKKI